MQAEEWLYAFFITNKIQMNKKILSISAAILMIAMSFKASAQTSSRIFQLPEFQSGKFVWIIRAGVGFNGVVGSNKETQEMQWEDGDWNGNFEKRTGYDVTFGFSKSFGKHPLYWGMELGLSSRGYKTSASWKKSSFSPGGGFKYRGKFQDKTLLCHTVKLSPVAIGYRYTFLKNMAADIHLGAYASYDYAGHYKEVNTDRIFSKADAKKETTSTKTKLKDIDGIRNCDAGINLGIGYWYGRFNIDFTWQRGFIALYKGGSDDVKIGKKTREIGNLFTNNFQIKLGYAF